MSDVKTSATYIDPKEFNDFVKNRNNGERTRFYTRRIYQDAKSFNIPKFNPQDIYFVKSGNCESEYLEIFYTVTKPRKVLCYPFSYDGPIPMSEFYKASNGKYRWCGHECEEKGFKDYLLFDVKFALISPDGTIYDRGPTCWHNIAFEKVCEQYFNTPADSYIEAGGAYIKMDEVVFKKKVANVIHRDRYDIPIEIGDIAMYCSSNGRMEPFIVSSIEPETVNRRNPRHLIVIQTNNSTKKLKWGLIP